MKKIAFGATVKIVSTTITKERGLAGLLGEVLGTSIPSSSGVEVLGGKNDDVAYGVYIEDLDEDYWLPRELLEPVND